MANPTSPHNSQSSKKGNNEWRCECGKLLFKGAFLAGLIEVKCSRCKRMVYLQQFDSYTAEHESFMTTISLDGTILTTSQGVEDSLGYSVADMIGKNFVEYINPKFHGAVGFWMSSIKQEEDSDSSYVSLIVPLIARDDREKIFSLLVRPTHLSGQDIYLVIGEAGLSSADAHDKKVLSKIAQKSRKQREGWDFIISSEGKVIDSSGKSKLGYGKDELSGKSFLDLLESPSQELIDSLKKQEAFVLTLSLKTKDSGFEKFEVCFAPDFLAEQNKPAFIVALRPQEVRQFPSSSQTSAS